MTAGEMLKGKCDTCDKPATSAARDRWQTNPEAGPGEVEQYAVTATMRRGCADHPAKSRLLEYEGGPEIVSTVTEADETDTPSADE